MSKTLNYIYSFFSDFNADNNTSKSTTTAAKSTAIKSNNNNNGDVDFFADFGKPSEPKK